MERYTYHIHPHKTITNIIPGKGIRRPMGLKLTKEEVMKCMACGPVYRVFPGIPPIRVTGSNLDSLHVSVEEYTKKENENLKQSDSTEKAPEAPISEPTTPEIPKNDTLTEEKPSEKPVTEEKIVITDPNMPNAVIDIDVTSIAAEEPVVKEAPILPASNSIEANAEEAEEVDEEDFEEEEEDQIVEQNGQIISQQPHYKKKKKRH